MPRPAISLAVVGSDFPNKRGPGRRFEIQLCVPGEPVHLIPEPKNPADPLAVAIFSTRGVQLGYLKAERAPLIGGILRQGREVRAIFQDKARYGAIIRVAFDGEQPALPAAKGSRTDHQDDGHRDDDFWPDFIPRDH